MRLILFFIVVVVMQSCMTIPRIQRNCDKFLKVCSVEKSTVTVYRDTIVPIQRIIPIHIPESRIDVRGQKITIVRRQGKPDQVKMEPIKQTNGVITIEARIENNVPILNAYLNDSTILYHYQDSIRIANAVRETMQKEKIIVKKIPALHRTVLWLFIIENIIFGFIIYIRSKNNKFRQLMDRIKKPPQ